MKKAIVFSLFAFAIWACGNSDSTTNDTADSAATSAAEPTKPAPDGKKIYKQYCVTCHGLYGDMGASGAHDLTASELAVEERITVITKGRGAMTPFENLLDEDEIAAVAEYSLELKK